MFYTKGRLDLYATLKIGIVVMKLAIIWVKYFVDMLENIGLIFFKL